jgi:hypothetical protein
VVKILTNNIEEHVQIEASHLQYASRQQYFGEILSPKIWGKQGCRFSLILFSIVAEILQRIIKQLVRQRSKRYAESVVLATM